MIGYVTLGTNDLDGAGKFYDVLLAEVGAERMMETDTLIAWATKPGEPALSVTEPADGTPSTVGNGVMVAIAMDAAEKVDAFHIRTSG